MAQDDDEVDDDYEDNNQWLTPITIIIMIVIIMKITIITMITFITFDKNQVSRPVARLRRSRFIPSAAYNDHTRLRFGCQGVTMMQSADLTVFCASPRYCWLVMQSEGSQ